MSRAVSSGLFTVTCTSTREGKERTRSPFCPHSSAFAATRSPAWRALMRAPLTHGRRPRRPNAARRRTSIRIASIALARAGATEYGSRPTSITSRGSRVSLASLPMLFSWARSAKAQVALRGFARFTFVAVALGLHMKAVERARRTNGGDVAEAQSVHDRWPISAAVEPRVITLLHAARGALARGISAWRCGRAPYPVGARSRFASSLTRASDPRRACRYDRSRW